MEPIKRHAGEDGVKSGGSRVSQFSSLKKLHIRPKQDGDLGLAKPGRSFAGPAWDGQIGR